MTINCDFGKEHVRTVSGAREGFYGISNISDSVLGNAFNEHLADKISFRQAGAGGEVGGVEGLCKSEMLLCDDTT